MFDAVLLFAKALRDLSRDKVYIPANVSCDGEDVWRSGKDLYDYLQKVRNFKGHICHMHFLFLLTFSLNVRNCISFNSFCKQENIFLLNLFCCFQQRVKLKLKKYIHVVLIHPYNSVSTLCIAFSISC